MAIFGIRASPATLALALVVAGAVVASCLVRPEGCYTVEGDKFPAEPPVTSTGPREVLHKGDVAVGDGRTEWHFGFLGWVYVIPEGMELQGGGAWRVEFREPNGLPLLSMASVHDVASGSTLWLDGDVGLEVRRRICPSSHDVNSLFDQIVGSRQRHAREDRQ